MYKLTKHFRLQKSTKRFLATISDPHVRGAVRRAFAQAQYASTQLPSKREASTPAKDPVSGLISDE